MVITFRKTWDINKEAYETDARVWVRYLWTVDPGNKGFTPLLKALVDIQAELVMMKKHFYDEFKIQLEDEYRDVWCWIHRGKITIQANMKGIEHENIQERDRMVERLHLDLEYERW